MIPNDDMVIGLTNALSEDYYIKRVIEHPPRSGGRADHMQRYWDIAGRRYDGVYPIEFPHGADWRGDPSRRHPPGGRARPRSPSWFQGAYTNDEMKARIKEEWDALHDLTKDTMDGPGVEKPEDRCSAVLHSGRCITVRPSRRITVRPGRRTTVCSWHAHNVFVRDGCRSVSSWAPGAPGQDRRGAG